LQLCCSRCPINSTAADADEHRYSAIKKGNIKIPAGIFQLYPNPDNKPVFEIAANNPDRFLAWVFINLTGEKNRQTVEYLGAEKCLFGTDGPYGLHEDDGLFDYGFIKRRIEKLFPEKRIQDKIWEKTSQILMAYNLILLPPPQKKIEAELNQLLEVIKQSK